MVSSALVHITFRVLGTGIVPLLLVLGLLMAPVSCTCGAAVPHGHSLFQLPNHHHGADDHANHQTGATAHDAFTHPSHPLMSNKPECDELRLEKMFAGNFALSNMMEQQDSAVLKAPPTSSTGQPMVISQPSLVMTPTAHVCDSIELPAARTLEGLETSPETPPPRA